MCLKSVLLIATLLTSSYLFAEDMQISNPPVNKPVCLGSTCPYQIKKDNYLIEINCKSLATSPQNYQCTLSATNGKTTISKNIEEEFDAGSLHYYWLSPTLLEIEDQHEGDITTYFDNRVFFINLKTLQISPLFYSVYATNVKQMVVLADSSSEQDETINQTLYVMPMFNSIKNMTITRNFGLYDHDIYHEPLTRFLPNGDLLLTYLNASHKRVQETIQINYKALANS